MSSSYDYHKKITIETKSSSSTTGGRPASPGHPYDEDEILRYGASDFDRSLSPTRNPPHSPGGDAFKSRAALPTASYVEDKKVQLRADQKILDSFEFVRGNTIQFTGSEKSNTVYIDFPFTSNIWRIDFKFSHDESHPGTTADFGVVNSSSLEKFYTKWLYNNPDVVAYYICKSSSRLCVGTSPKTLLSAFNIRTGSEIGVEVDMDNHVIRFYHNGRLVPYAVRVNISSVHIGFSGRFRQAFEDITLRRVDKPTVRPQDKLEILPWTGK